jgi:hypothetical protein
VRSSIAHARQGQKVRSKPTSPAKCPRKGGGDVSSRFDGLREVEGRLAPWDAGHAQHSTDDEGRRCSRVGTRCSAGRRGLEPCSSTPRTVRWLPDDRIWSPKLVRSRTRGMQRSACLLCSSARQSCQSTRCPAGCSQLPDPGVDLQDMSRISSQHPAARIEHASRELTDRNA